MKFSIKILIFIFILLPIISCSSSSFKRDALEASEILKTAFELEQYDAPKKVLVNNTPLIRLYLDNKESIRYLKKHRKKLNEIYNKIRKYADQVNSEKYNNSIAICISINQSLLMLSSLPFEDNIITKFNYTYKVMEEVDNWVIDSFFANVEVPEEFHRNWEAKKREKKIRIIHEGLTSKEKRRRALN